jgi:hypothetical protein
MKKKTILQLIEQAVTGKKYFSVGSIKRALKKVRNDIRPGTVNQYLYGMSKKGDVYRAGRGWYSSVPELFHPSTKSVDRIASMIKTKYPLLTFSVWSTEQLQPFTHHLMTTFTRFVCTDVDAMPSITGFLKEQGYQAYLDPKQKEADKYFDPSQNAVVIRTSLTREPVEGSFAAAEKILVDLFIEKDRLSLIDGAEYGRIFRNLVLAYRVNIARLLEYGERRKIRTALIDDVLRTEKDVFFF